MLALLALFGQISHASFQLSKYANPKLAINSLNLLWNPFFSPELAKKTEIDRSIDDARQRMDFMTFSFERSRISKVLRTALQSQINIHPFESRLWNELIQLQRETDLTAEERIWTIEAGLLLYGWRERDRARLSAGCVESPPILIESHSGICRMLLGQLTEWSISRAEGLMGISPSYLKRRLGELDQQYSLSSAPAQVGWQ